MTATVMAPPESLERLVTATLTTIGNTSDDVADFMRSLAIKGRRNDETDCPLARLLLRMPEVEQVAVIDDHVYVWGDALNPIVITLPKPVAEFVTRYDARIYLDLIELPAVTR